MTFIVFCMCFVFLALGILVGLTYAECEAERREVGMHGEVTRIYLRGKGR